MPRPRTAAGMLGGRPEPCSLRFLTCPFHSPILPLRVGREAIPRCRGDFHGTKGPDLNETAFDADGFLRTGDLFQIKGRLHLKFYDRAKDIIIRGGLNISAQEVENLILAHPDVQDAAAVGMPDENLGERTCAFIVPRPGRTVSLEGIAAFMKEQGCAVYKLPERIEVVEAIPRNPVGKIVKKALRKEIAEKLAAGK